MAEAYFKHLVEDSESQFEIDSAGTSSWHVGESPHSGIIRTGIDKGLSFDGQQSRQIKEGDFDEFDVLVAMDRSNFEDLIAMSPDSEHKIHLLLDFSDLSEKEVHDPYYDENFGLTYDQVAVGCEGLLNFLMQSK
jgi:protein-tyrosine phosphatase